MKVGFIGTGRMGLAMARRLIEAKHDLGVFNRTPDKIKGLIGAGAKAMSSLAQAARYGEAVFTMLADDAALDDVAGQTAGLLESLPQGGIHVCSGTHGIGVVRKLKALHAARGQVLVTAPMLGRPEMVASGQAVMVIAGPAEALRRCAAVRSAR